MTSTATPQSTVVLHLSDLHFGNDGGSQSDKDAKQAILSTLLVKLKTLPPDWNPNVVCISGDIGWHAKEEDYKKAEGWILDLLRELGLTSTDLILCPGNHDIDRNSAVDPPPDHVQADSLFSLPVSETDVLHKPFAEYSAFCVRLGVPPYKCGDAESYLVGVRQHCGLTFVSHNSAWFAKDSQKDNGRLWVGQPLLKHMNAMGQYPAMSTPPAGTVISLMHHPFDWLHDAEKHQRDLRKSTKEYICYRSSILLTGHTHDTVTDPTLLINRCWHFPAGATYDNGQHFNTFRLIRINPPQLEERSYEYDPRTPNDDWRQKGGEFSAPLVFRPEYLRVMASNTHLFQATLEPGRSRETSDVGLRSLQTVDTEDGVTAQSRDNYIDSENKRIVGLIKAGHTRVAQREMDQLYKRAEDERVSNSLLARISNNFGISLLENGLTDEAAVKFKAATEYSPDNATMWANLAEAQLRLRDIESGRESIDKARHLKPLDIHVLNVFSDFLLQSGQKEQFAPLLEEVHKVVDESQEWQVLVAQLHFDAGQVSESRRILQALEKDVDLQTASKELFARVLFESVHAEARKNMKLALQLPKDMQADVEKAIGLLGEVIKDCRNYDSRRIRLTLLTNRASAHLLLGHWEEAINDYDKVLAEQPNDQRILQARLFSLICAKRFEEAMQIASPETDPIISFGLAGSLIEEGKPEIGLRVLDLISPKSEEEALPKLRWQLKAWQQLGSQEKVQELIGQLEKEYPDNAEALFIRAEMLYETCTNEAVQLLQNGLSRAGDIQIRQAIILNLANLLLTLGRGEEAVVLLEKEDHEQYPRLHKKLAAALYFCGRADRALTQIEKNIGHWKDDPEIVSIYVEILESIGDYPKAVDLAKLLLALDPENIGYRLILARIQPGIGDYDGALDTIRGIDHAKALLNPEYIAPLAFHFRILGEADRALELMFTARDKYSSNPDIHQAYITIYLSLPADHPERSAPNTVEIDNVVTFTQDGVQHSFLIVDRHDADVRKGEISAKGGMAQKLLGAKVGDELLVKDFSLEKSTVRIDAISTRFGFAFGESLKMFSTWFPERSDIQKGDINKPEAFKNIITEKSKRLQMLFTTYSNNQMSIGSLSKFIGTTVTKYCLDVIQLSGGEILCSTGLQDDLIPQRSSVESARQIVLDITALLTVVLLGLEDFVLSAFERVVIPGTILSEFEQTIQDEILSAKSQVPTNTPWSRETQKRINLLLKAKEFALKLELDRAPEVLLDDKAEICDLFGKSGAAAAFVAQREQLCFYADDLTLRLVVRNEYGIPGFSSPIFLRSLVQSGHITSDEHVVLISKLLQHGYWFVPMSSEDLYRLFKLERGVVTDKFRGIAKGLRKPCTLPVVTDVVMEFMGRLWFGGVPFSHSDLFLEALLGQIVSQYPVIDVEVAFINAVRSRYSHLPFMVMLLSYTVKSSLQKVLDLTRRNEP